jgi:putative transposase
VGRNPRLLEGNVVYHVFNRRTDKQCLFASDAAYEDFLGVIERAKKLYPIRFHAYCLINTHWHFAASAEVPRTLSACFQWVATTHAVRFRVQTGTRGNGHVYQDRFKTKGVESAVSYVRLLKYIEANPVAAGLVERAEEYRWSSLHERKPGQTRLIEPGPWELPDTWLELVNTPDVAFEQLLSPPGSIAVFWAERPNVSATWSSGGGDGGGEDRGRRSRSWGTEVDNQGDGGGGGRGRRSVGRVG